MSRQRMRDWTIKSLILAGSAIGLAVAALLLWRGQSVFLLAFTSILLAILLRTFSNWLSERTRLPNWLSLLVIGILLLGSLTAVGVFVGPSVAEQVKQLGESLPRALRQLEERIEQYHWGEQLVSRTVEASEDLAPSGEVVARATGILSTTMGALASLLLVLFVATYMAVDPELYRRGFVRLIPPSKRSRAEDVLADVHRMLRHWMLARGVSMLFVGVFTAVGLWLLDVPVSLALGLLAALFDIIPNIGPLIAAVPAVLFAFLDGPRQVLYVILLYAAVQTIESYVVAPLLEKKTAALPPALTILAQVLLGMLCGALGLLLAAPLTATAMVLVRRLYLEDVLGDKVDDE